MVSFISDVVASDRSTPRCGSGEALKQAANVAPTVRESALQIHRTSVFSFYRA